jgi:hypothetical protein
MAEDGTGQEDGVLLCEGTGAVFLYVCVIRQNEREARRQREASRVGAGYQVRCAA